MKKRLIALLLAMVMVILCILTLTLPAIAGNDKVGLIDDFSESYRTGPYYVNLQDIKTEFTSDLAKNVVLVAKSQDGYTGSSNSDNRSGVVTENPGNYTEYNRWYHNSNSNKNEWCNLFVSWCLHAAGVSESIAPKNPFYISHSSYNNWRKCEADVYSWKDYISKSYIPKPGDILLYETNSSSSIDGSAISGTHNEHVGIIINYDAETKKITTMEGNTTGEKVAPKTRKPRESDGYGYSYTNNEGKVIYRYYYAFIRPKYSNGGDSSQPSSQYLTISGETKPTGNLPLNKAFVLKGVIQSDSLLKNVTAEIINTSTNQVVSGFSYSTNPNSYSYNIQTDGVDDALKFGKLPQGNYRYLVTAENASICAKLIDSYFTMGGESGSTTPTNPVLTISGETKPTGDLPLNKGFSLQGVIQSDPVLTNVTAQIIDTTTGQAVSGFYYSVNPNSASYNIQTDGVDKALKFGNLLQGNYRYLVTAENASISKVLIDSYFTMGGGVSTVHTHDKGTYMYYWADHPHYNCYQCYVCGEIWTDYDSSNYINTCEICNAQIFPGKPVLMVSPDSPWANTSVTFSWNPTENTTHYNIWLSRKNSSGEYEPLEHLKFVNSGFQKTLDAGEYKAELQSYNSNGWFPDGSDWLYFQGDPVYFTVTQATIFYDANGGNGEPEPQDFTPGGGYYFSTTAPVREGYSFVNWRDEYNGCYYNPGDPIPASWGTNTLEAQWQPDRYYLEVDEWINGERDWGSRESVVFDIYINGVIDKQNISFEYEQWPYESTYEIRNIRPAEGYSYDGVNINSELNDFGHSRKDRAGVITGNTSVELMVHKCPTSIDENPDPVVFGGHTYYHFTTPVTWYDAKSICEAMGGHLATISSAEEDAFVYQMAQCDMSWLGATDVASEGTWNWITDEELSYTNWHSTTPDNYTSNPEGAENYLHYSGGGGGVWNDNAGCTLLPFVCEIDSIIANSALQKISLANKRYAEQEIQDVGAVIANIEQNTVIDDFVLNFENDASELQLFKADGKTKVTTGNVGTGYILKLIQNGTVVDEKVLIVTGDNSGDGIIDVVDVKLALNTSLGKEPLTGVYSIATEVSGDGIIDVVDVKLILNVSLGKQQTFEAA